MNKKSCFILLFKLIFSTFFLQGEIVQFPNKKMQSNQEIEHVFKMIQGNLEFKNLVFKDQEEKFLELVQSGQSPKILYIGCSDSRVIPELISQAKPGDLFVIRTAGNFVPTYDPNIKYDGVAATIEYAVQELMIKDIIVCGHSHCGAIKGLFSKEISTNPKYRLLYKWLQFGVEAKRITNKLIKSGSEDKNRYEIAERISVLVQLENLMTYPFVKEKVTKNELQLHGWYFSIETGEISFFDPKSYQFIPISNLHPKDAQENKIDPDFKIQKEEKK